MEESVGSNSPVTTTSPLRRRRQQSQLSSQQAFADRVARALQHRLLLLHRSGPDKFFVLGATSNVYAVTLNHAAPPSCTCPDRATPCKHVLFVLIRALGVGPADLCHLLRGRRHFRPCHLSHILSSAVLPDSLASSALRRRFRRLLNAPLPPPPPQNNVMAAVGGCCPVCLEEMKMLEDNKKVVVCWTCRNAVHEECHMQWKRSRGRRAATCVLCRARWRDTRPETSAAKYMNLAAYIGGREEDDIDEIDDNIIDHLQCEGV